MASVRFFGWLALWCFSFVVLYGGYIIGVLTNPAIGVASAIALLGFAGAGAWAIDRYRPGWFPDDDDGLSADEEDLYQSLREARKRR